ncbi:hypothetical protein D3C71_1928090 [compost metagenome]
MIEQVAHEVERILVENLLLVVALGDEVIELLAQVMEEHGVLVDVLQEVLLGGQPVLVELYPAVLVIEVQHRVQRVVIERRFRRLQGAFEC